MKSKKGIVITVIHIVELLLALLFFFIVASIFSKSLHGFLFRNEDTKAFNAFIDEVKSLQVNQEETFMFPAIQETGALIFISKKKDQFVNNNQNTNTKDPIADSENTVFYHDPSQPSFFVIPEICKAKSCICLCRNDFSLVDDETPYIICLPLRNCARAACKGKLVCETFDDIDFRSDLDLKTIYPDYPRENLYQFNNGFYIREYSSKDGSYAPFLQPSIRTWHMKRNADSTIDFCMGEDCISKLAALTSNPAPATPIVS